MPAEPPPPYSRHQALAVERRRIEPQEPTITSGSRSKQRWGEKRYLVLALILVVLVLFGIIFGTVFGLKKAQDRNSESIKSSLQDSLSSTATPSAGPTSTSMPVPPLLQPRAKVPRNLGAAAGAPFTLLLWDLRDNGRLWWKQYGGEWEMYADRWFLSAPVTVRTSRTTQKAVAVDAVNGHIVYMNFDNGEWGHDNWHELEMECCTHFLSRPAVVSRAEGRLDVVNIDSDGKVFLVSYNGSSWSKWTELGFGFDGELSATTWAEDRIDVFGKRSEDFFHMYWNEEAGWAEQWEELGNIFHGEDDVTSSPLATSWRTSEADGVIDVVINSGSTFHRLFSSGQWSDWHVLPASHEGGEFPDTQSMVQDIGIDGRPFVHMISRGTDDFMHYNYYNGTSWNFWSHIWHTERQGGADYVTEYWPTVLVNSGDGATELIGRDRDGQILRYETRGPVKDMFSNDKWESLGHGG